MSHNASFSSEFNIYAWSLQDGTEQHVAQVMSSVNNQSFKTNEKRGNRLLQDDNFQIDDTMFRKYIKILFKALQERKNLQERDRIQINVDYTTDNDDFLILMSSIKFGSRAMPLYFSMRLYPRRKNQMNHHLSRH